MTGITPAWLTFSGKYVEVPPYIRRPTMRLAYWTGMRRWPCSTNTTPTTISSAATQTAAKVTPPRLSRMVLPSAGMRAAIPAKISSDMPFPMPRSVTISPSHITRVDPAVITSTITDSAKIDWSATISSLRSQPCKRFPLAPRATIEVDCSSASATER
ncbi:Uncharacterised protein [Mycobacteroides abscessus subsp. abscessus]|nr:Uncharacterised protein [Mycobacteroides abscessus subsp. abscessus]